MSGIAGAESMTVVIRATAASAERKVFVVLGLVGGIDALLHARGGPWRGLEGGGKRVMKKELRQRRAEGHYQWEMT